MPKKLPAKLSTKLSVAEKFYLEKNREVNPKQLAKDLGLTLSKVETFLNGLPPLKKLNEEQLEAAQAPINGVTLPQNYLVSHKGAVIMTKAESERSDEFKPKTTRLSKKSVTTTRK